MRLTPAPELLKRCRNLQRHLVAHELDAALLAQNADLFYFTGSTQQGLLYIPREGEPLYLVRRDHGRARMESGLKEVLPLESPRVLPALIQAHGHALPERIGLELDVLPVAFHQRLVRLFPDCESVDVTPMVREVRAVKSDYEIGIMKDAALLADKVIQRVSEVMKAGMTDLDLAAELEFVARKNGHQGLVRMRAFNGEIFYGHVFSGTDSAAPGGADAPLSGMGLSPSFGQGASYKTIRAGEPVLVDFVACFDGYLVDLTRLFCIGGMDERLHQGFDAMIELHNAFVDRARPGSSWQELYDFCVETAGRMGYADQFMGAGGAKVGFVGHGVGIELDEYPFIARGFADKRLEENMAFAFEPKLVFPGLGAVGIENTFWVGADGLKSLTYSDAQLKIL
ncbi:MAG: Xaa-Pro peptidase family protein [Geothermobacteraceae bacterium]